MQILTRTPLLAFISQSGNVMKTSLAAATAAEFAKTPDLKILAVDLDHEHRKQGSLTKWDKLRTAYHPERERFDIASPDTVAEAISIINAARDYDAIILDCPSRATRATVALAEDVDLVVMPMTPTDKDMDLTIETASMIAHAGIPLTRFAAVLTRCRTKAAVRDYQSALADKNINDIRGHHMFVVPHAIMEMESYTLAMNRGLSITEASTASLRTQAKLAVNAIIDRFTELTEQNQQHQQHAGANAA